ncbi:MAG: transcriptional regulator [Nocardioidaceae bacterium]
MARPGRLGVAYPHGVDPTEWGRRINVAHDDFLMTGKPDARVRPAVAESWRRSLEQGADPEATGAPVRLAEPELARLRVDHPLAATMPIIRRLLVESATDAGLLVAVSDAVGRLLWVEGHSGLRSRAEGMSFIEGADWSEGAVGTNAPGTALAIDDAVAIFGAEHLARPVTPWSCSAAPIHDPITGSTLGVLDVTGGAEVASAQSLSLVRATVAAVESELRFNGLMAPPRAAARPARLDILGAHQGILDTGTGPVRLSLRHSEILVLLSEAVDGLTADELSLELGGRDRASVTIRAEMSRLRSVLRPIELASRPYRLDDALRTDLQEVRALLDAGDHAGVADAYDGPVLPQSVSPGVVRIRDDLNLRVRGAASGGGRLASRSAAG